MKFLVDESTGVAVAKLLQEMGHDTIEVASVMPKAEDEQVLASAFADGRIILTNDKDFGEMIFRSQLPHHGVVLFRLDDEHLTNRVKMARLVVTKYGDRLAGAFTVVTERGIRIRKM